MSGPWRLWQVHFLRRIYCLFPSLLFSALRGLIEQFKVILLQGPLIDFICVFSRGQGKGGKNNKIAALGFTVIFFLAIHSYNFCLFVSFLCISLFSYDFHNMQFYMFFCFISMIFPILIEVCIEENNSVHKYDKLCSI